MARFVLRYRGAGPPPEGDVARVVGLAEVVVIESTSRMLLVEGEPTTLEAMVHSLPDWAMAPDQAFALPDTRRWAERPPDPPDVELRR